MRRKPLTNGSGGQSRDDSSRIQALSRRNFLKSTTAGLVGGTLADSGLAGTALAADFDIDGPRTIRARRVLLQGGSIITMDPQVGNFAKADVLIEGKKILAIHPKINAQDAQVIDATGMILIPGFCDSHIHSWQGQLPRIIANQNSALSDPLHNYMIILHERFAPIYRPEDMYIGNLMTMLHCMNAGITTVNDCSHNSRSSAHSDSAIQALFDAGIRSVHSSAPPSFGNWDHQWPQDLYRIKKKYFSSEDQLVTLRIFPRAGMRPDEGAVLQVRRDLDLWYTFDTDAGVPLNMQLADLYASGILTGKESYNHAHNFPLSGRKAIADHGAKVNVAPRIDSQFFINGRNKGIPATQDWLDVGILPGISSDDPATYAIDIFTEMKLYYAFQRGMAQNARFNNDPKPPAAITVRDTLEAATLRGAEGCALDRKVGTLTPGKEADIVMIQTNGLHLYPMHNAIVSVVEGATVGDVDTVFIAGKLVKRDGRMVGVDIDRVKRMVDESRDYLFAKANWKPDPFVD